jgi:hypothetical protein
MAAADRPLPTRNSLALLREAKKLLPTAIKQARGDGKRPGSPALLRLIARLAMRPTQIERSPKK